MEEIWRNIKGWPEYQVSNTDKVLSSKQSTPKLLKVNLKAAEYFGFGYTGLGKSLIEGKEEFRGHKFRYLDK